MAASGESSSGRPPASQFRDIADDYDGDATTVGVSAEHVTARPSAPDDDVASGARPPAIRPAAGDFEFRDYSSATGSSDALENVVTHSRASLGALRVAAPPAPGKADASGPHDIAAGSSLPYEETVVAPSALLGRQSDALVGRKVANRYVLVRVLGEGGMGTVFEAKHVELGKRVAIKVLSAAVSRNTEATSRFLREARAASAIDSEHIVHVFDVGEDQTLGPYMVMELLKGDDVATAIATRGRLRPDLAAGILRQVCLALERAHASGIIHRDLKPANIFLAKSDDGSTKVKVLDFGIAKLVRDARIASGTQITRVGATIGTPQYMSPEQAQALPTVDSRTDIYSLGAVFYEMLVGAPAYPQRGSYEQMIFQILSKPAPRVGQSLRDFPVELDQLVADMMAPTPQERPSSVADVRARLFDIFPGLDEMRLMLDGGATTAGRMRNPLGSIGTASQMGIATVPPTGSLGATTSLPPPRSAGVGRSTALRTALLVALTLACGVVLGGLFMRKAPPDVEPSAVSTAVAVTSQLVSDAQRALAGGDTRHAAELAQRATDMTPASADAWLALGAAHERLGNADAARAAYASCARLAVGDRAHECVSRAAGAAP